MRFEVYPKKITQIPTLPYHFRSGSLAPLAFCPIFGTGLHPVGHAGSVQGSADDMVSGTGKVLHTAATDKDYAVFLKIVAYARNIAGYFYSVRQPHTSDFPQGGVRFFRSGSLYGGAHAPLLGGQGARGLFLQRVEAALQRRGFGLLYRGFSALPY